MYYHLDVNGLSDGRVVFKLELEQKHPRQPSLLMRSSGGQQEQPFEFLAQSNGRDYFTVVLTAPQPFEYALRVTTPAQCWWLTPKGEEHDRLPHNWFPWPPSRAPEALEEMGRNEKARAAVVPAQVVVTGSMLGAYGAKHDNMLFDVHLMVMRPAPGFGRYAAFLAGVLGNADRWGGCAWVAGRREVCRARIVRA